MWWNHWLMTKTMSDQSRNRVGTESESEKVENSGWSLQKLVNHKTHVKSRELYGFMCPTLADSCRPCRIFAENHIGRPKNIKSHMIHIKK